MKDIRYSKKNLSLPLGRFNVKLGLRVVRGPDWCYGDVYQEGLVGTVVEIGGQCGSTAPERYVGVIWDSGDKAYFRAGNGNAFDLHTFDTIQCGVKHEFITCKECGEKEIAGIRWKCTICNCTDLCTWCYMYDKHDITHTFIRYETELSIGVRVPPRSDSQHDKRLSCGIFKGAFVSRGQDWNASDQDGGPGKKGQVIQISRSGNILVKWSSGNKYSYRLGSNGKVDLKFTSSCYGNFYYKSHLPILGKLSDERIGMNYFQKPHISVERRKSSANLDDSKGTSHKRTPWYLVDYMKRKSKKVNSQHKKSANYRKGLDLNQDYKTVIRDLEELEVSNKKSSSVKKSCYKIGEKATINVGLSSARKLEDGHGGFPEDMLLLLNKIETTFFIKENGDDNIKLGDSGPYQFNPEILSKMKSDPDLTEQEMTQKKKVPSAGKKFECTRCQTHDDCAAFVPCGHIASCRKCSKMFVICPLCRKEVKGSLRVFIP